MKPFDFQKYLKNNTLLKESVNEAPVDGNDAPTGPIIDNKEAVDRILDEMIGLHAVDWAYILKQFAESLRQTGSVTVSSAVDKVGNLISKYAEPMYNGERDADYLP